MSTAPVIFGIVSGFKGLHRSVLAFKSILAEHVGTEVSTACIHAKLLYKVCIDEGTLIYAWQPQRMEVS